MLYFHFFKSSLENLPGVVVGLRPSRIPRHIFKRSRKKIKISEKSTNYQPNAQYQPKKRHYLYNICFKVRLKICRGIRGGRRPTTTPGKFSSELLKKWKYNIFKRLRKQNQNIQTKVPTTQPNPQYSAKNNVTIHMIYTFMPPPFQQTIMLYCYMKITK